MTVLNEEKEVAHLAELLALKCGETPAEAKQIYIAGMFHDIGKFKLPECILNKPGALNGREFNMNRLH